MDEKLQGFHVSRLARDRYQFDDTLFNYLGKAFIANFHAARGFANRMNQRRNIGSFPNQIVPASQVNAVALIQGIMHYIFRLYLQRQPQLLPTALEQLRAEFGPDLDKTLRRFLDEFPPQPVYNRVLEPQEFLAGSSEARSNQEVALEELVMLWLANSNPAYSAFAELFGDDALKQQTAYSRITAELNGYFRGVAKDDPGDARFPGGMSIIDLLLEPVRAAPYSLEGQLRYLAERWGSVVGAYTFRLLTAMDILKEDFRAIPGPGGPGGKGTTPVPYYDRADLEFEAYTPDRDWMPNLVMLAKNAYVWLDQLSKKYGRIITTLDQIPDEELDRLAAWGITGLWLIGLWERSQASQRIKQMTGNPDAVASAYSLFDYQIAGRLGGQAALDNLHERAWKRGVRLASDMVPNHVGIDGRWVIEHPDWFLSLDYSPYPNYTFNGPNLSWDGRVGIYLEDHYYDRSDAAVVFKRVDHYTGDTRYIYHGNDGTSMPWNDTAQLNYLNPEMREAMIQTILHIARQFPIIRFDAAMTLVKRHIQRLWFPEPGTGGAIPSRAEHGLTKAEFDRLMPEEFWREVVDRAAVEAPDTLLLAEAFWLLEGYFVRTLGMHRVYNSAFMNMLRDEENAKYRSVIKNTIEFDPEVLRRYVNFLNNPDEKTAVEQFGKDDKYFGVTTLLVTMPGLPMIGHGQIEGFAEKYGMEYYRAYWDEQPDTYLIQRHEREIFPLCRRRYLFAGVENFLLYDFYAVGGGVDENVFAFSNRVGDERALVLYNNAFNNTRGWIQVSAAYSVKTGDGDNRRLIQRTVAEGLGIPADDSQYVIFREHRSGLEYIRNCRELSDQGFYAELNAYQCIVLLDFRIVASSPARPYAELAAYLGGRGVPSMDEAMSEITLKSVRGPFRELVNTDTLQRVLEARETPDEALLDEVQEKTLRLVEAVQAFVGEAEVEAPAQQAVADELADEEAAEAVDEDEIPAKDAASLAGQFALSVRGTLGKLLALPLEAVPESIAPVLEKLDSDPAVWGGLYSWLVLQALGDADQSRSWIDEWLLGRIIMTALQEAGAADADAARTVTAVKLATGQRDLFTGSPDERADKLLETLLDDTDAQQLLNVNHFQGVLWFNQEGFDTLLLWLVLLAQLNGAPEALKRRYATVERLLAALPKAGYQVEKLRAAVRAR
ncbi:MAG: alpha-amylase [Chloroflexi bacterium]|nr:alpha-amylase [Chloroflexota bacterium]